VYIEGSLRTEKWQDKQGQERYTNKIIASEMQMLGGKSDGSAPPQQQSQQAQPDNMSAPAPVDDSFDDDIPFR